MFVSCTRSLTIFLNLIIFVSQDSMEIGTDFQRFIHKEKAPDSNNIASAEIGDENMSRHDVSSNNNNEEADSTLAPIVDMIESASDAASVDACDVSEFSPMKNNNNDDNEVNDARNSDLVTSTSDEPTAPASKLNNIQDIFKEAKTSNVNVVATAEMETNNDICFDSEKFPKKERRRNIANANYYDSVYQNVDNLNDKDVISWMTNDSSIDNLDLKRIKVNHLHKEKVSE